MEKIRKEVHLPTSMLRDLKVVAAHADKSVKKYMEDLVTGDVKVQMVRITKNKLP